VTVLPVRLAANSGKKGGAEVTWTHLHVTMPGGAPVAAHVETMSATITQVTLPRPLAPGERVILDGELTGRMTRIPDGATDPVQAALTAFAAGQQKADGDQYGTFACGDGICTLTEFTPEVPSFIDGHFDTAEGSGIGDATYSEPLNVLLGVVTEKNVELAVTGFEIGRVPSGKNLQRTSYAMAAAREVGIAASSNYAIDSADSAGGVRIRSLSLQADQDAGKKVLVAAKESLADFEQAFGPYPWSFLNVAAAGLVGGAGGLELPAMALVGSGFYHQSMGNMLSMLGVTGDLTVGALDFITRHEVAHQWWHAQVGSHAQIHPYIDEPLAQWSAVYSVKVNQGEMAAEKARNTQVAVNFQGMSMFGIPDGKVARPASAFSSPIEYAGIVYGKAPFFYDAAARMFGEDKVLLGLHILTEQQRFKRATPEDVWNAMLQGVGARNAALLQKLWHHWFEETHGTDDLGSLDINSIAASAGIPLDALGGNIKLDPATMKQLMKQLQGMTQGTQLPTIDP
jgi:hypothetical protein